MPGLVCKDGKGDGFFGFGGDTEIICGFDFQSKSREPLLEHTHEGWVFRAPARGDEFLKRFGTQHMAVQSFLNRSSRQGGGGGYNIFFFNRSFPRFSAPADELLCKLASKLFAPSGARRFLLEEIATQSLMKRRF